MTLDMCHKKPNEIIFGSFRSSSSGNLRLSVRHGDS